jgi:GntR family transcriptional regulator/MocR family aminotransferase
MWDFSHLDLKRSDQRALAEQISRQIGDAIVAGLLQPGARLPSWRDLAAQLGVARGTVRAAYDRLSDAELVVTSGAAGTFVAKLQTDRARTTLATTNDDILPPGLRRNFRHPATFQMGAPAHDAFPLKLWSRLHRKAVSAASFASAYDDPRGSIELRTALSAHLAVSRGVHCTPDHIIITSGFRGGLSVVLHALETRGEAWIEEPGYPVARNALRFSNLRPVPVAVDGEGIDVEAGIAVSPEAKLAIVTPGQQAPLGVVMSNRRRRQLLDWAADADAWIVEDDYLSELQLDGRPARALASIDKQGSVIHIGSFSKTVNPPVGAGFVVAPPRLVRRLVEVAAWLSAPPNLAVQLALASFLSEGHLLRHLRRLKKLYVARRASLITALKDRGIRDVTSAGLAVLIRLPAEARDLDIVESCRRAGLEPSPLSIWYVTPRQDSSGLLLGITNVTDDKIVRSCDALASLLPQT